MKRKIIIPLIPLVLICVSYFAVTAIVDYKKNIVGYIYQHPINEIAIEDSGRKIKITGQDEIKLIIDKMHLKGWSYYLRLFPKKDWPSSWIILNNDLVIGFYPSESFVYVFPKNQTRNARYYTVPRNIYDEIKTTFKKVLMSPSTYGYYIDTPNPMLHKSIKQASAANGEDHPELVGLVLTTHGQINSLDIWGKSFGMADDREVYLVLLKGDFSIKRSGSMGPLLTSHLEVEIDATSGDVITSGASSKYEPERLLKIGTLKY